MKKGIPIIMRIRWKSEEIRDSQKLHGNPNYFIRLTSRASLWFEKKTEFLDKSSKNRY